MPTGTLVMPESEWDIEQRAFIEGKCELKEIAERRGIKYGAVRMRAQRGSWGKLRREYKLAMMTAPPDFVARALAPVILDTRELSNGDWIRANATYDYEIQALERLVVQARENYESACDPEEQDILSGIYLKLLERLRIQIGRPLVAPIRPGGMKSAKGNTVAPVESPAVELPGSSTSDKV